MSLSSPVLETPRATSPISEAQDPSDSEASSLTNRGASGTVISVSTTLKRVVAVAVLLVCQTPGAFVFAAGLDLAAHLFPSGHEHDTAALARSATHGHHHDDEVVPDHDHDVTLDAEAGLLRPAPSSWAVLAAPLSPSLTPAEGTPYDAASRRGPPAPLFRSHCALLL